MAGEKWATGLTGGSNRLFVSNGFFYHLDSTAEDDINDVGYVEVLIIRLSIFTAFKQLLEAVPTEDWFCEGSKLKQKERNQEKLEALTKSRTVSSSGQVLAMMPTVTTIIQDI